MSFLQSHNWPGNVRELENVVRKSVLLAQSYTITVDHIQTALNKTSELAYSPTRAFGEYLDELLTAAQAGDISDAHARALETTERELFARAIKLAHGNQARAARWLGISRITMKAKLVQFGLELLAGDGQVFLHPRQAFLDLDDCFRCIFRHAPYALRQHLGCSPTGDVRAHIEVFRTGQVWNAPLTGDSALALPIPGRPQLPALLVREKDAEQLSVFRRAEIPVDVLDLGV